MRHNLLQMDLEEVIYASMSSKQIQSLQAMTDVVGQRHISAPAAYVGKTKSSMQRTRAYASCNRSCASAGCQLSYFAVAHVVHRENCAQTHTLITRLLASIGTPSISHVRASACPGMVENVIVSPRSITCAMQSRMQSLHGVNATKCSFNHT